MWKPNQETGKSLDDDLKFILREKYQLPYVFDESDKKYFIGLTDAGVKGAAEVIGHIDKHGSIKIWESY